MIFIILTKLIIFQLNFIFVVISILELNNYYHPYFIY